MLIVFFQIFAGTHCCQGECKYPQSNNDIWCSSIKQSSLVVQFHIFYFNLSARLSVSLLSRCSIKNLLRYQHLRNWISGKLISPSLLASQNIIIIILIFIIISSSYHHRAVESSARGELLVPKKKRKPRR